MQYLVLLFRVVMRERQHLGAAVTSDRQKTLNACGCWKTNGSQPQLSNCDQFVAPTLRTDLDILSVLISDMPCGLVLSYIYSNS